MRVKSGKQIAVSVRHQELWVCSFRHSFQRFPRPGFLSYRLVTLVAVLNFQFSLGLSMLRFYLLNLFISELLLNVWNNFYSAIPQFPSFNILMGKEVACF